MEEAGFHLAFIHGKSQPSYQGLIMYILTTLEFPTHYFDLLLPGLARLAESPGLTTFIFRRNPESDICAQVFIL